MEAKDTVIEYRDFHYADGFKAGIKEVVDWVGRNNELNREPWCDDYTLAYGYDPMEQGDVVLIKEDWQAQLKEWGITPD